MKNAQDAVTTAESALADVQATILRKQKTLDQAISDDLAHKTEECKRALKELSAQEIICQKRAEVARQNLEKIVNRTDNARKPIKIKIPPKPQA